LEESLPSLFFSHTLISISLPTFCLSGRPTYQQRDLPGSRSHISGQKNPISSKSIAISAEKREIKPMSNTL
jgi:hypothetical protein